VTELVNHLRLIESFFNDASPEYDRALAPATSWEAFPQFSHSAASLCTCPRQHLLAKIAGSFSVVPLNILSADIFPREDRTLLAIFRVCDMKGGAVTEGGDRELAEKTLRDALLVEAVELGPLLEQARDKLQH